MVQKTSSSANSIFDRALARLHGPWCKQPLSSKSFDILTNSRSTYCDNWQPCLVVHKTHPWDNFLVHDVNNPLVLRTSTFSLTCALIIMIIDNHVMLYAKPRPWNMEPYSNHPWKAITKIRPSSIKIPVPYGFLIANRWVKEAYEVTWLPQQMEKVVAEIRNVSLFRSYRIPNWIGLTDLYTTYDDMNGWMQIGMSSKRQCGAHTISILVENEAI